MRSRGLAVGISVAVGLALLATAADADAQRRRQGRAATGTLVIETSMEGAEVIVDEETIGFTPLDPAALSPGSHTVRVRRPGYTEYTDVVEIQAGQELRVPVELFPLAMVLTVRSQPDEARVFVDGTFRGNTPIELELIEGEHSVRVTAPRFHEQIRTVSATPGQIDAIDVELEPLPEDMLAPQPIEWYEEPLTWILVGAGAAVIAVVIVAVAVVLSQPDPQTEFCGADGSGCYRVVPEWMWP